MNKRQSLFVAFNLALIASTPALASHPCSSPLILDLDGDGLIATTGLWRSVFFDINGDGVAEEIGWTSEYYQDAFLWLDRNDNRVVDNGRELFGNATLLADGTLAANGFEALAVWDTASLGGNEDGFLSEEDLVWRRLRLWVDRNHDGVSQPDEILTLPSQRIRAIGLEYEKINRGSGNLNVHLLKGGFVKPVEIYGESFNRLELMEDVLFIFRDPPE